MLACCVSPPDRTSYHRKDYYKLAVFYRIVFRMLSLVPERKNIVLLLILYAKIGRPIRSLDSTTKLVYIAMKKGVPFTYRFDRIDKDILECPSLIDDLDLLVESRLMKKEFVREKTEIVVTFQADVDMEQMEPLARKSFDSETQKKIEKFANYIRTKRKREDLDSIFRQIEEQTT